MSIEETKKTKHSNHIDFKDVLKLRAHLNPHARIHSRRRTHLAVKDQRDLARSVKRARFMALLPFVNH